MEPRNVWWVGPFQMRQIMVGVPLFAVIGWIAAQLPQLRIGGYELWPAIAVVPLTGLLGGPVVGFCVGALGHALLGLVVGQVSWPLTLATGVVGLVSGLKRTEWNHHLPTLTDAIINGVSALAGIIAGLLTYMVLLLVAGHGRYAVAESFWRLLMAWGVPAIVVAPAILQLLPWWRWSRKRKV
ncbi:MAG TPA: hypothetical protein EYH31_09855 [Anaerolineae bacterium]|nr:hypothetical protein [Anaerolineae bacterium]